MAVRTSAGTTIATSAVVPATFDSTGYAALTYSPIGEVVDVGELGRVYTLVTHNPVGNRSTQKLTGSFNEGKITLQIGLDSADAGQVLLKAACVLDSLYSFKMILQGGRIFYFQALVMSFKTSVGTVDNIIKATVELEISTSSTGVGIIEI